MFAQHKKWLPGFIAALLITATASANDKTLHIYNWSDFIAPDTLAKFQKETGIKVIYDSLESNEALEKKLIAGKTGYDLVAPSSDFLERQAKAGLFAALNKEALPNYKNLDLKMLTLAAQNDPKNKYGMPYMMSTTGIGYNIDKVKAILGPNAPVDSWQLVLNPNNLAKLKQCGVAFLDAPSEIYATALHYLGKDPNSTAAKDYTDTANNLLMQLRPSIRYFHSSRYINDLANGDICIAIGWSGDIFQAAHRAQEAQNGVNVTYSIPKEGALLTFDMFAIPADSKNKEEAHQFLNFLMQPEIIAEISNYIYYPNVNLASIPLLSPEIRNNPSIYPPADVRAKFFSAKALDPKVERAITRAWTQFKNGA